jgi:hypothetical protein
MTARTLNSKTHKDANQERIYLLREPLKIEIDPRNAVFYPVTGVAGFCFPHF